MAQTTVSDQAGPGKEDTRQAKVYLRVAMADDLQITPSLQWIENSGFDNTATRYDKRLAVYGVRAS